MKRLRLDRLACQLQPPRNPRLYLSQQIHTVSCESRPNLCAESQQRQYQVQTQWKLQRRSITGRRGAANTAMHVQGNDTEPPPVTTISEFDRTILENEGPSQLRSPSHTRARGSAKLSALHARLSLPSRLPLETLARCLIHRSVDSRPGYNNAPFAVLGQDLLGLYTTEHLVCNYPRLPMSVLFAAQHAYVGSATLSAMRSEWGVEVVAAPGPEVDPGLLQLERITPGNSLAENGMQRVKDVQQIQQFGASGTGRPDEQWYRRRGISSRIVYDDQFGDLKSGLPPVEPSTTQPDPSPDAGPEPALSVPPQPPSQPATVEEASASFVRALTGALYLHAGADAAKSFHKAHVLSRQLALHSLFNFTHPTRDLTLLCKREGFEPPVARLISETGRISRSPVFVVGVFSGDDKLGEGAGSSLNEARVRAAAAALRSWYLYSPPDTEIVLPSEVEGPEAGRKKKWKPQLVDVGEIVT